MSQIRLTPALEVSALLRRAQRDGGHGAVLAKGDPDRGSLLLLITERGAHKALLERSMTVDGAYRWSPAGPGTEEDNARVAETVQRRRRNDPDLWVIELDIVPAERFIAETIAEG